MNIISLILSFIFGALLMFLVFCLVAPLKETKPKNNVHFYVARDKNSKLWLYMGKPVRTSNEFSPCHCGKLIGGVRYFSNYGLKESDFENLKWENKPIEVFINMED